MGICIISLNTSFFKPVLSVIFNFSYIPSYSSGQCTGIQRGDCPQFSIGAVDGPKNIFGIQMSCSFLGRISTEEGGLCGQGRNGSLILRQTDCIQAREGIKKVEGGMYHGFVSRHTKTKSVTEKQFCSVLWRSGLLLFLLILFVCLFVVGFFCYTRQKQLNYF